MRNLTGSRNNRSLFKQITASGLVCLLLVAGAPAAAAEESCQGWKTAKFFESATLQQVRACLSAGEDPNKPGTKGFTALHRAARETSDPAVIEALLEAGANPRAYSTAGRLPWQFARKNDKIKGSDAYQRLRIVSAPAKKADWSRVQAVSHDTKTEVRLYQDEAAVRRFRGRFESATADSITLVFKDGQTRSFPKQAVRKVIVPRPFSKRTPGWITLGVVFGIMQTLLSMSASVDNVSGSTMAGVHATTTLPAAALAFFTSGMGAIYSVPPRYRPLPQADKQSGAEDNASGKQVGEKAKEGPSAPYTGSGKCAKTTVI